MSWNGGDGAAGPSAMGWGSPPPSEKPYAPTVKVHMVRHPDGTTKEYELSPAQHALLCFFVEKRSVPAHEIVGFVAKIRSPDLLARALHMTAGQSQALVKNLSNHLLREKPEALLEQMLNGFDCC